MSVNDGHKTHKWIAPVWKVCLQLEENMEKFLVKLLFSIQMMIPSSDGFFHYSKSHDLLLLEHIFDQGLKNNQRQKLHLQWRPSAVNDVSALERLLWAVVNISETMRQKESNQNYQDAAYDMQTYLLRRYRYMRQSCVRINFYILAYLVKCVSIKNS